MNIPEATHIAPAYGAENPAMIFKGDCSLSSLVDPYADEYSEHWITDETELSYIQDRKDLEAVVIEIFPVPLELQESVSSVQVLSQLF